jgi:SAM-dependent methyltransferase
MNDLINNEIRDAVRETYGKVAKSDSPGCGCSGDGCCGSSSFVSAEEISMALGYSGDEVKGVPEGANMGLGCGNPQSIAGLKSGEIVLDLGSGGGFDSFLAARQVGESGLVIGVDMTTEMINKARVNAEKGSYRNVEFRQGEIENLPVASDSVDVIISNCVINLSPDKPRVFSEAFRVLKEGGRMAVSDIVAFTEIPEDAKKDIAMHTGCFAGASMISEVKEMLSAAGFEQISVVPVGESKTFMRDWIQGMDITDYALSASIEAVKPYKDNSASKVRNTSEKSSEPSEAGCCGGPAAEGVDACCVQDANEKEKGNAGCGCNDQAAKPKKIETKKSCCA